MSHDWIKIIPPAQTAGGRGKLVIEGRPSILLGGQTNNSSGSNLEYIQPVLDGLVSLNSNLAILPLYWDLVEAVEGRFDFTLLEGIVESCRSRGLHLVFLWFGAMKNAISCYAPAWVKTDLKRFPRAEGEAGKPSWTLSMFSPAVLAADARAFAAVMRRIGQIDADRHTVLMVQVENETGVLSIARDRSAAAEAAFAQAVPAELMSHLARRRDRLSAPIRDAWDAAGARMQGTWAEVFAGEADEVFMAWHVARYVEQMARAGKAEYDLPMYANAWLIAGPGYKPGQYPSGGPVTKVYEIWRAAAPSIALLAPDIYQPDFRHHAADYAREDNPLFVPETNATPAAAAKCLYAIGQHGAIGFAPFGIDAMKAPHPLADVYAALREMGPPLAEAAAQGRTAGFLQQADDESWMVELDGFRLRPRTSRKLAECAVPGSALLVSLGGGVFLAMGYNIIFTSEPTDGSLVAAEILESDEGRYASGEFLATRRLNGDESCHGTGVVLHDRLTLCRFRLHAYGRSDSAARKA